MRASVVLLFFLLQCVEVEGSKHERHKATHTKSRIVSTSTSASKIERTNKSIGLTIGLFSLKKRNNSSKTLLTKKTVNQSKKKKKTKISKLLRKFKECMQTYQAKHCKKRNFKKAMIWPKKMLPALEKMLMKKLNGGPDAGYDNYDNPTPSVDNNDYSDNWDGVRPHHHHFRQQPSMFNGMEVVPLLKRLKEKVGNSALGYDSNTFGGIASSQDGSKYLTKMLLNQALGKPDRGTVMKDMMQEFSLANRNERSGEEAREAFNELMGHNNLMKANSDMEGENSDANFGALPGGGNDNQMGRMTLPDRVQSFSQGAGADDTGGGGGGGGFGGGGGGGFQNFGSVGGVVQAQELPNGKIAPVNQGMMGSNMQQMMPLNVNPTTRMLNEKEPNMESPMIQSQMQSNSDTMRDSDSRPIALSKDNNLVFEEEGENAARGIKPPPFSNPMYAQNVMNLGPNYQSATIPETQGDVGAGRGDFQLQGGRYAAAFDNDYSSRSQDIVASRRNDLPTSRAKDITSEKAPMRSSDLPSKPHNKSHSKIKKHPTKQH